MEFEVNGKPLKEISDKAALHLDTAVTLVSMALGRFESDLNSKFKELSEAVEGFHKENDRLREENAELKAKLSRPRAGRKLSEKSGPVGLPYDPPDGLDPVTAKLVKQAYEKEKR